MIINYKGVPRAFGKSVVQGYLVPHILIKSIITTCIAKYENAHVLYIDFCIYLYFLVTSKQLPSLE
jgi:hypothetical protein